MKAVESAPSANKSRSKFGRRNAIKNASRFLPAPNRPANTISRIKPSTRLHRMAMATTPVARVLTRRSCAVVIGEQRTVSQKLRKKKIARCCAIKRFGEQVRVARFRNHAARATRRGRDAGARHSLVFAEATHCELFQKQIHTVKIDDAMTVEEQIYP